MPSAAQPPPARHQTRAVDGGEERALIAAHEKLGNRWADIAAEIPGRTENAVKNHWNATNRRRDVPVRKDGSSSCCASTCKALGRGACVAADPPSHLAPHINSNIGEQDHLPATRRPERRGEEAVAQLELTAERGRHPTGNGLETTRESRARRKPTAPTAAPTAAPWARAPGSRPAAPSRTITTAAAASTRSRLTISPPVGHRPTRQLGWSETRSRIRSRADAASPSGSACGSRRTRERRRARGRKKAKKPRRCRAPDADDDELMAVVTRKVRQTRGKIWLGEDALDETPAAKKVKRNGPGGEHGVNDGEVERKRSATQARRPSADSCDTFLDPLEPTYCGNLRDSHNSQYRASLSFGYDDEEDDRIMNQAAAAAAAAHDHHGSVYFGGSLDVRTEDMVDAVVAAVTASEEERGLSIHGPGPDARLNELGVQSRPRRAVMRRVKTFAAAEDVVEVVGGNDCVSAERCVDLAREEEEEDEDDGEGRGAEEIEVATYASARPFHRSIADALGAEPERGHRRRRGPDDAADDAMNFFQIRTRTSPRRGRRRARTPHERLEPVSERLAAALSRVVDPRTL